jgi:oligopeptide/dipeptide ABC transporter ATP-binding protein
MRRAIPRAPSGEGLMLPLLAVHDLSVVFDTPEGPLRAVDGLSFHLGQGETLGLVGESGSGKTMSALAVLRIVPRPGRIESGRVFFRERNILRASEPELRKLRGRSIAMIFQDPQSALHPLLPVGLQLSEVLEVHEGLTVHEARERSAEALGDVGLADPERLLARYPHELSGGMRQRVMIAMALLCRPQVLFADEPTTALDATLQAQVLELLDALREKHGTGIALITHDLSVVAGRADRVQVLYAGRTVEVAPTRELFRRPLHPYTRGLLNSVPRLGPSDPELPGAIPGQPPDPRELPPGCAFHPRCSLATERCRSAPPDLEEHPGERAVACYEAEAAPRP